MRVLAPALIGAALAASCPSVAVAESQNSSAASGGDARLARAQAPMLAVADALERAGEHSGAAGFAGITLDVPGGFVDLYWKGTPPAAVAREAGKRHAGFRVRTHPAKHSAAELDQHARSVLRTHGVGVGGSVHRVTPLPDGTGIEVGVVAGQGKRTAVPQPADPLVVRTETEAMPTPYASRWGGDAPWEAGIQINSCSVAFPGYAREDDGRITRKLISAAHCFRPGDQVRTNVPGGPSQVIGTVQAVDDGLDTALIAVDNGDVTNRMWDGGVEDGTEYTKVIAGTSAPRNGSLVCTSGAFSGVHCDIKITKTNSTLDWGTHTSRGVSTGDQLQKLLASGSGDSGGPVFTLTGDGSQVLAAGVIIGGDPARPASCTYRSTRCSTRLLFTDFRTVKARWGLYT
ncbi:S1 family peptidase [Streptomyces sp. NPDC087440]|uniref:S1 family peptidase n=1 Tax=Streptomyces sp. NPDC087440 TaxID=3365790 RepID=UPI003821BDF6